MYYFNYSPPFYYFFSFYLMFANFFFFFYLMLVEITRAKYIFFMVFHLHIFLNYTTDKFLVLFFFPETIFLSFLKSTLAKITLTVLTCEHIFYDYILLVHFDQFIQTQSFSFSKLFSMTYRFFSLLSIVLQQLYYLSSFVTPGSDFRFELYQ